MFCRRKQASHVVAALFLCQPLELGDERIRRLKALLVENLGVSSQKPELKQLDLDWRVVKHRSECSACFEENRLIYNWPKCSELVVCFCASVLEEIVGFLSHETPTVQVERVDAFVGNVLKRCLVASLCDGCDHIESGAGKQMNNNGVSIGEELSHGFNQFS